MAIQYHADRLWVLIAHAGGVALPIDYDVYTSRKDALNARKDYIAGARDTGDVEPGDELPKVVKLSTVIDDFVDLAT